MNWFRKHLNWSYMIVLGFCFFVALTIGVVIEFSAPYTPEETFDTIGYIIWLTIMIPVSIMVLKAKGRSLWWLLLIGWLSPVWLSNKRTFVDEIPDLEKVK